MLFLFIFGIDQSLYTYKNNEISNNKVLSNKFSWHSMQFNLPFSYFCTLIITLFLAAFLDVVIIAKLNVPDMLIVTPNKWNSIIVIIIYSNCNLCLYRPLLTLEYTKGQAVLVCRHVYSPWCFVSVRCCKSKYEIFQI